MATQLRPTNRGPFTNFQNETVEWPDSGGITITLDYSESELVTAISVDNNSIDLTDFDGKITVFPNSEIEITITESEVI